MLVDSAHGDSSSPIANLPMELFWEVDGLAQLFWEVQNHWGKALGITGSQFMILQAVEALGWEDGVAVNAVATKLNVHSSFVTAQTKALEKTGFIHRRPSSSDARVVLMSLSAKAREAMGSLCSRRDTLHEFVFAETDDDELEQMIKHFRGLRKRLARGARLLAINDGI